MSTGIGFNIGGITTIVTIWLTKWISETLLDMEVDFPTILAIGFILNAYGLFKKGLDVQEGEGG